MIFEDDSHAKKRCAHLRHFHLVGAFTDRLRTDPVYPAGAGVTTAQPVPGPTPVANGSIFQSAQPINYGYQPLFEDRRPRNIGDTLTIVLQENVSASKSSSANASRDGKTNFGFDTVPRYLQGLFGNARADVDASGGNSFNGKGGANASNTFSGTLTVTVDQVLVNGNLHVVGEKQIAINQGTEFIRFSGVVNPRTISGSNTVPSTRWQTRALSTLAMATLTKHKTWVGYSVSSLTCLQCK